MKEKKSLPGGAEGKEVATNTQLGRAVSQLKLFFISWVRIISNFACKVRCFEHLMSHYFKFAQSAPALHVINIACVLPVHFL